MALMLDQNYETLKDFQLNLPLFEQESFPDCHKIDKYLAFEQYHLCNLLP